MKKDEELMRSEIFDYYVRKIIFEEPNIIVDGYKCGVDINNRRIILLEYLKTRKSSPVVIPNIFDEIGQGVIQYCYKLLGIKFGDRVEVIHKEAFSHIRNINYIDLRDCTNLVYIGESAFCYTDIDIELNISKELKICQFAFRNNRSCVISINGDSFSFQDIGFMQYNKVLVNGHMRYVNQVAMLPNGWFTLNTKNDAWKKKISL